MSTYKPKGKLGSGARFKALSEALGERGGVKDPKALAAYIGAKKFSRKRMTKMAVAGKKRAS